MTTSKADLIIHPVRMRILQFLSRKKLTTQEIANRMPDVPLSSLYRHLKKLLDGGMIEISETHTINGLEEKVYTLTGPAVIGPQDVETFSKADHLHYFSGYVATLIQGFKAYLESQETLDLVEDRVGYREVHFYASQEELDELFKPFNLAMIELLKNPPGKGRRLRKLAVINHPEIEES